MQSASGETCFTSASIPFERFPPPTTMSIRLFMLFYVLFLFLFISSHLITTKTSKRMFFHFSCDVFGTRENNSKEFDINILLFA